MSHIYLLLGTHCIFEFKVNAQNLYIFNFITSIAMSKNISKPLEDLNRQTFFF